MLPFIIIIIMIMIIIIIIKIMMIIINEISSICLFFITRVQEMIRKC